MFFLDIVGEGFRSDCRMTPIEKDFHSLYVLIMKLHF